MKPSSMRGKSFLYKGQEHFVKKVTVDEEAGTHVVETDKGTIRCTSRELVEQFLPIEDEKREPPKLALELTHADASQISQLSDIVLASIKKVQNDPEYVAQAHAINEGAKVLIDVKRLVLDAVKIVKDMKG